MEAALTRGALSVQGDGAITAAAGKASLTASRLRAEGADLSVSARYDLVAGALDARLALVRPTGTGNGNIGRPEIAVGLQGSIDSPRRTLDIAALVDWLSMRAIAENTKRQFSCHRQADPASGGGENRRLRHPAQFGEARGAGHYGCRREARGAGQSARGREAGRRCVCSGKTPSLPFPASGGGYIDLSSPACGEG